MKPHRLPLHRSELRKDIISGEWVLFAPGRFHHVIPRRRRAKRVIPPQSKDPFKYPLRNVDEHVIWEYRKGKKIQGEKSAWDILVLQNKYPAVADDAKRLSASGGFFPVTSGVGHHDLLITRSYTKNFPKLSKEEAFHVFEAFRDRYLMLFGDKRVKYVSIFHNWGKGAGASVYHPHYQILGVPVVPPDVERSLVGALGYFRRKKRCAYCDMIRWEKKKKTRIILESRNTIAFSPFVSQSPFEIAVFPKRHHPYFENMLDAELADIAHFLQRVLRKTEKNLKDPDYNFYIHTAPIYRKEKHKKSYHWHIEVTPRWNIPAGFEYATGIFINVVDPDLAASVLKK